MEKKKNNAMDEYITVEEVLKLLKENLAQAGDEYDDVLEESRKAFRAKDKKEMHKYRILVNKHRAYCLGICSSIDAIEIQINTRKNLAYIGEQKNDTK